MQFLKAQDYRAIGSVFEVSHDIGNCVAILGCHESFDGLIELFA